MKAASFDYVRADSLDQVCALLDAHGPTAKLIAGGQSLVPMLAMRLSKPSLLIDINDVQGLQGIAVQEAALVIGGGTRQYQLEQSPDIARSCPIIQKALAWVGHPQTRNRGTLGGSLVHADPSAELPLVSVLLNADIAVQGVDGEEILSAADFYLAPLVTALQPDQCVVRISFPIWGGATGSSFHEVSPRQGDFAMASAAVQVQLDEAGRCSRAAIGVGGVAATPLRLEALENALIGLATKDAALRDIANLAANEIDPDSDLHATADYRRQVVCRLIERALSDALAQAEKNRKAKS